MNKISEVYFRLLGTIGCRARAKNEKFSAAGSRCRQNLKIRELTNRRLLHDDAVWSRHILRRRPVETGVYDSQ